MKADLAIYSHTVDVGGQHMSESLTLGHNLDFSSCDIMISFCKSSHIRMYMPITYVCQWSTVEILHGLIGPFTAQQVKYFTVHDPC